MTKKQSPDKAPQSLRRRAEDKISKDTAVKINSAPLSDEETQRIIHELQIHQIELELQNEELKRAQDELEESKIRYYDLYDNAPLGYFTIDKKGMIIESNATASKMLGVPGGSMDKQLLIDYILTADRDIFYLKSRKLVKTGLPLKCELRMQRKDKTSFWVELHATPLDANGEIETYRAIISNIDIRRRTEQELAKKDTRLQLLFEHMPIGLFITDSTGNITRSNNVIKKIFGMNNEELQKKLSTTCSFFLQDRTFLKPSNFPTAKTARLRKPVSDLEIGFSHNDESTTWLNVNSVFNALPPDDWEIITTVTDITETISSEKEINKLLKDKQLLLEEVHHRVKNNMVTIHSLIMQQINRLTEPSAIDALTDTAGRVSSMMTLYDKLNQLQGRDKISIKEYLPDLVNDIMETFPDSNKITVKTHVDDFTIPEKKLMPIGLIISELLTNIMKYAFTGKKNGLITITAKYKSDAREACIVIRDDGHGISDKIDFESSKGFGFMIIEALMKNIQGSIRIERFKGTAFILEFKP